MQKPKLVNKLRLTRSVGKKLHYNINSLHIANVISLFVNEFANELQNKEQINIPNFGVFRIEKSKPRKFFHIGEKRFAFSKGNYLLKIKLSQSLRNKIIANLDLIKTFV